MMAETNRAPDATNTEGKSGTATRPSVDQQVSKYQQALAVVRRAPDLVQPVVVGRLTLPLAFRQALGRSDVPIAVKVTVPRPRRKPTGCPAGCGPVHECGIGEPIVLPPADKYQLGGRYFDHAERDYHGAQILQQMRGAA